MTERRIIGRRGMGLVGIGFVLASITATVLADGGGPNPGAKWWDCQFTACLAGGSGSCPSGEQMCCCPTGAQPPAYVASCMDETCNGQSNCDACM